MQRIDIWALFEHPAAPRYTRDNICLIGDAAHAATPHQGSGAGMAVEDAWLLRALLREVNDAEDIQAAFTAFQKERIELARTSHEAGQLYDFELPGYEDDDGMIAENLKTRMRWIWDEDLEKELERAMITLKAEIKTATCMDLHVLERKSVTARIASDQAGISLI
ncbi:Monooxygenase FAD-binding protein [Macrophomina phaseolina MS6]|uniref:Monooxygenase FAD-binding protein n=1 Tax=Macrophomina phaseolina (strain MS6) TaxID=1126212 RepID=K2R251_MACPH|nr:Monooxygenase FAD-binding protein [Macrophomina phaseolina MS6]